MLHLKGSIEKKERFVNTNINTFLYYFSSLITLKINIFWFFVSLAMRSIYIYLPEDRMSVCEEAAWYHFLPFLRFFPSQKALD